MQQFSEVAEGETILRARNVRVSINRTTGCLQSPPNGSTPPKYDFVEFTQRGERVTKLGKIVGW